MTRSIRRRLDRLQAALLRDREGQASGQEASDRPKRIRRSRIGGAPGGGPIRIVIYRGREPVGEVVIAP